MKKTKKELDVSELVSKFEENGLFDLRHENLEQIEVVAECGINIFQKKNGKYYIVRRSLQSTENMINLFSPSKYNGYSSVFLDDLSLFLGDKLWLKFLKELSEQYLIFVRS